MQVQEFPEMFHQILTACSTEIKGLEHLPESTFKQYLYIILTDTLKDYIDRASHDVSINVSNVQIRAKILSFILW